MRGDNTPVQAPQVQMVISIHSPRMRGDDGQGLRARCRCNFNPLPSHEGRRCGTAPGKERIHISIHSPRMRGDELIASMTIHLMISIHSPRMRGDGRAADFLAGIHIISIHSPRMRGDTARRIVTFSTAHFNPLPSHEGRRASACRCNRPDYFNPLPSHEGRLD